MFFFNSIWVRTTGGKIWNSHASCDIYRPQVKVMEHKLNKKRTRIEIWIHPEGGKAIKPRSTAARQKIDKTSFYTPNIQTYKSFPNTSQVIQCTRIWERNFHDIIAIHDFQDIQASAKLVPLLEPVSITQLWWFKFDKQKNF